MHVDPPGVPLAFTRAGQKRWDRWLGPSVGPKRPLGTARVPGSPLIRQPATSWRLDRDAPSVPQIARPRAHSRNDLVPSLTGRSTVCGPDHDRSPVLSIDLVVDPGAGLELSADVVVQLRPVESQRAPADVHNIEHGAAALSGGVVLHDGPADRHVVVLAVEVDGAAAAAAGRAG